MKAVLTSSSGFIGHVALEQRLLHHFYYHLTSSLLEEPSLKLRVMNLDNFVLVIPHSIPV